MCCRDQEWSGDGHCGLFDASEGGVQKISTGESGDATRPVTSLTCDEVKDGLERGSPTPPPRKPEERAGVVSELQPCTQLEGGEGLSGAGSDDIGDGSMSLLETDRGEESD